MARYIHCEVCKTNMQNAAERHGEFYESIERKALKDMFCDGGCGSLDGGPTVLLKGSKCFAAVLLNRKDHPFYKIQRPEVWARELIEVTQ